MKYIKKGLLVLILLNIGILSAQTPILKFARESIVSLKKNEYDFVIGNIIGSNIFNIILVLAISLFINNIYVSFSSIELQLIILIIISSLLSFIILMAVSLSIVISPPSLKSKCDCNAPQCTYKN